MQKINKKKCYKCKFFRELYWEDGTKAGLGRCVHPEQTKQRHATTGRYITNTCERWEIDFSKVGLSEDVEEKP